MEEDSLETPMKTIVDSGSKTILAKEKFAVKSDNVEVAGPAYSRGGKAQAKPRREARGKSRENLSGSSIK